LQEKDRDGCPKIINLGGAKTDLFYERKKYGKKGCVHSLKLLLSHLVLPPSLPLTTKGFKKR